MISRCLRPVVNFCVLEHVATTLLSCFADVILCFQYLNICHIHTFQQDNPYPERSDQQMLEQATEFVMLHLYNGHLDCLYQNY